jgi:hypothetical protein
VTTPRRPRTSRLGAGIVLVAFASLCWILYGLSAGSTNRPYHPDGPPPSVVRLVAGQSYWLAVPDGVRAVRAAGADPARLSCTATRSGEDPGPLAVTGVVDSNGDTKFTDRIGSFVAARGGAVHVACQGIGAVYVESSDGGAFDWSGVWLVLASLGLVVGAPLLLSALRRPARVRAGDDQQVE